MGGRFGPRSPPFSLSLLPTSLPTCLPAGLLADISIYQSVCLLACCLPARLPMFVCLFVWVPFARSTANQTESLHSPPSRFSCLSYCLPAYLPVSLLVCFPPCLLACLSACPSPCLPVCLTPPLSLCVFFGGGGLQHKLIWQEGFYGAHQSFVIDSFCVLSVLFLCGKSHHNWRGCEAELVNEIANGNLLPTAPGRGSSRSFARSTSCRSASRCDSLSHRTLGERPFPEFGLRMQG